MLESIVSEFAACGNGQSLLIYVLGFCSAIMVMRFCLTIVLRRQRHGCMPRGLSFSKFLDRVDIKHSAGINRDGFSKKKIPDEIDVIVVGSGIGGLACAGFLSRIGKRCLVLEQHYIAGGCTHAFEEHGYEFDTGIHYIGNIEKRKKILDLITESPIEWDQMGSQPHESKGVYDEIVIGSRTYEFAAGERTFVEDLVKRFPNERDAIEMYVKYCKECAKKDTFFDLKIARPAWLARFLNFFASRSFFSMVRKTALEVVSEVTDNKELRAVLLGQFGDYGHTPSTASWFLHASVANHYFEGGWYPRGGSQVIANKMIPVIERTGGRVLVRKAVERILLKDGRAVGVRMSDGTIIRAKYVVSACGVLNTYKKLLPKAVISKSLREKIERIGPSGSMCYLFVGMKGTVEELKLRSSNIWHWPTESGDYDKMLEAFYKDPEHAPIPLFIGFPCAKDSTWPKRYPGKSNAVILTMIDYKVFAKWENEKQGKRGESYEKLKSIFERRMLEEGLYRYYPQIRGRVDVKFVGSPVTFNHFIGSTAGEVYGLDGKTERFQADDWLRPQTDIPGLYLTGADITTLGVTGALMAGVLTAHSIAGYGNVLDMLSGRNMVEDIMHMDAATKRFN